MAITGKKPLLIGGMGICALLWLGGSLQSEILMVGQWGFWGLTLLGLGAWSLKRSNQAKPVLSLQPLKRETVATAIADTQAWLTSISQEYSELDCTEWQQQLSQLNQGFERENLTVGIVGDKRTGKTVLKTLLQEKKGWENLNWIENNSLFVETQTDDLSSLDLILFLVNGDLGDRQWQILQDLYKQHHRCLLIFNKQDHFRLEERSEILQQLQQQVKDFIPVDQVLAITAAPQAIIVRKHQADGQIEESWEQPNPDLGNLFSCLQSRVKEERESLVLGTIWRQTQQIKTTAKNRLNQIRRDRALPIIEQYQWLTAGTAFVNPVASLDLLATAVINGQMVLDLSQIYQQKLSLAQAQTVAVTLGELMLKLGLVELSSQAIAGLLKTQPLTYLAGGVLQGISAAYLTRIAGLSLIEYLQEQEASLSDAKGINQERLSQKLQQIFEQTQRFNGLQNLVQQAFSQFKTQKQVELY